MLVVALIAQFVLIIWLLVLMSQSTGSLKKRIDRASRHLEMTDRPKDPKPICGCEHHQCFHEEGGGCKHMKSESRRDHWDVIECGCLRYTGPEALPTVLP